MRGEGAWPKGRVELDCLIIERQLVPSRPGVTQRKREREREREMRISRKKTKQIKKRKKSEPMRFEISERQTMEDPIKPVGRGRGRG